jgi:hypothetical protein
MFPKTEFTPLPAPFTEDVPPAPIVTVIAEPNVIEYPVADKRPPAPPPLIG